MSDVLPPHVVALMESAAMYEYERDHPLRPPDCRGRPYAVWRAAEHAICERDELERMMSEVPHGPLAAWS